MLTKGQHQDLYGRLEIEISKYMDITTIYKRLKEQGFLTTIYQMFFKIFETEQEYTLQELFKLAQQDPTEFNIGEHYKMNSHIFKQNIALISSLIVDDVWVLFNSRVQEQLNEIMTVKSQNLLEKIEELSNEQAQFDSKLSPINQQYSELENEEPEIGRTFQLVEKSGIQNQSQQHNSSCNTSKLKQIPLQNTSEQKNLIDQKNSQQKKQNKDTHFSSISLINMSSDQNRAQYSKNLNSNSKSQNHQAQSGQKLNGKQDKDMYIKPKTIIAPTQQNYRTMQYLSQIIKDTNYQSQTPNHIPDDSNQQNILLKNFANNQSKDFVFDSHLSTLGYQEVLQNALYKKKRQKNHDTKRNKNLQYEQQLQTDIN